MQERDRERRGRRRRRPGRASTWRAAPTRPPSAAATASSVGWRAAARSRPPSGLLASAATSSSPTRTAIRPETVRLEVGDDRAGERAGDLGVARRGGARRSAARRRAARRRRRWRRRGRARRRRWLIVVMRVSLGVPTIRAARRYPLVPAVAWAKLMPSTTTSRGAAAGWFEPDGVAGLQRGEVDRAEGGRPEPDGDVDRDPLELVLELGGGAGTLGALAVGDRRRSAPARSRWGSSPQNGMHMDIAEAALVDLELEVASRPSRRRRRRPGRTGGCTRRRSPSARRRRSSAQGVAQLAAAAARSGRRRRRPRSR